MSLSMRHDSRMAQRTIVETIDDVDGSIIPEGEAETTSFSLDGVSYEIHLTSENRDALASALDPWIVRARRITAPKKEKPKGRSKEQTTAIRQWAIASGYTISDRGRIPADIEARFHEAEGVPLKGRARPKKNA